ncbi:hypothetical protein diail_2249 [Diaporthe ilicicola]|nr:hypothetical protein diail_2249 [Diaporthe ilicicola]
MGKVHGSLARAGKVKSQTPKVEKQGAYKPKNFYYAVQTGILTDSQLQRRRRPRTFDVTPINAMPMTTSSSPTTTRRINADNHTVRVALRRDSHTPAVS